MTERGETSVLDDEAWSRGERFWRELVDELLSSMGQEGEWPSWEPRFYGDGVTPIAREDLAICDGRSWLLDRSFAIEQLPQAGLIPTISAEVKDFAAGLLDFPDISNADEADRWFEEVPARDRVPRSTLIIRVEFSEATASSARSLLSKWLEPETTVPEMEAFIEDTPGVEHW